MVLGEAELDRYGLAATNLLLSIEDADDILDKNWPFICTVTQTVASVSGTNVSKQVVFDIGWCGAGGGVKGAEHWNNPGHTPKYSPISKCLGIGCTCEGGPVWYVGFDHAKVNTRDLSIIKTHLEEAYQRTEHCLGLVWGWSVGNSINLLDRIAPNNIPSGELANLCFTVQTDAKGERTVVENHILKFGENEPKDMVPDIYYIELRYGGVDGTIFDRLWVVINSTGTFFTFNNWWLRNLDTRWTANLPAPFASITVKKDANGNPVSATIPGGSRWNAPIRKDSFLHHDAVFDMRSKAVGNHGHQATYDADGNLLTEPIAAGTADLYTPSGLKAELHRNVDVYPFIRALQLDGNPVQKIGTILGVDAPMNLTRPCLYVGTHIKQYMDKRPVLPNGGGQ
jgi:hypothetical protein